MRRVRSGIRLRAWTAAVMVIGAAGWAAVAVRSVRAQAQVPATPPPALPAGMTPDRVQAFITAASNQLDYLPGEVLVKFRAGVTPAGQNRALTAVRDRPTTNALRWVGQAAVLKDAGEPDARILARQLATQPEVEYAEPNYLYHTTAVPNDPGYALHQWNFAALDMPRAWDIASTAGQSVIVAVIDTGETNVTQNFTVRTWNGTGFQNITVPFGISPELPSSRFALAQDFVTGFGSTVLDVDGHGTHTASTVAEQTNNNSAEAGMAYNATIMPVKVCAGYWDVQFSMSAQNIPGFAPLNAGGCPDDAIAAGIRYAADNGASVVNMSFGGPDISQTVLDALKYAVGKGVFLAASGGNDGQNGNPPNYPAAHAPDIQGLMSVAAVGQSLKRSFYSTVGSYIEIAAPGGDSRDGGQSGEVWQVTLLSTDSDPTRVIFPRFDRYIETPFQGTSMAAPHVAGAAALLVGRGIKDPATIEALLEATAKDLGAPGRDNETGFGLIQPRAALFGYGAGAKK